jgi:hypothetical protein
VLALASCRAAAEQDSSSDARISAIAASDAFNVSVFSGARSFVDGDWRRANEPELYGVELCARGGPWALIAGASLGEVEDVVDLMAGAPSADVELGDVYCGVRWYFVAEPDSPLQPYVAAGSGWIGHHVLAEGHWTDPDDEHAARTWFGQAGIELRVGRGLVLAADARYVGAEPLRVAGAEVDPSYTALVLRLGVGW